MKTAHLARKPLAKSSVAANVLEHGTGALNIDGTRIAAPNETLMNHGRSATSAVSKDIYGDSSASPVHQTPGQKLGRWPANVALRHLEDCRDVCAPGCPVADLDLQNGDRPVSGAARAGKPATATDKGTIGPGGGLHGNGTLHNDKGGASRFYKHFQGEDAVAIPQDLMDYLHTMITPTHVDGQTLIITDASAVDWDSIEDASYHGAIVATPEGVTGMVDDLWRVLKPGAHVMAVAPDDQPTGHTGACALEDKGFEIRDAILLVDEPNKYHYVPKPSQRERHAGCEQLKLQKRLAEEVDAIDEDLDGEDLLVAVEAAEAEAEEAIDLHPHKGNVHPCLHPDALVMTPNGFRPILELGVGSLVYAEDGTFRPVVAMTRHPYTSDDLFEIEVAGTNLTTLASDNHPFLIWRPERTKKGGIKGGTVRWLPAAEVVKGDYTLTPVLADHPMLSESTHPKRGDTEFWFLFGLYLAEGSLQRAGHGTNVYPSYTLHEDETHLRDRIAAYTDANTSTYPRKEGASMQVMAFDPEMGEAFRTLGGTGAATKSIHPVAWNLPKESREAILEGHLAGDGGDVRTWRQAKTVSPDLASQIRLLAESVGYKANLHHYPASPGKIGDREFKTTSPEHHLRFYNDNQKLADDDTARKPSRPTLLEHAGHTFMLRYVQGNTPVPYQGDVVNLSVEGSPTFQTAVGMSHNTIKPKAIMAKLLEDVPKDATVLDPFMGSGSEALACLETGHNYIGIELDPEYIQIADARVRYWDRNRIGDGATIESEAKDLSVNQEEEVDFMDFME